MSWTLVGLAMSIFLYVGSNVAYTSSTQSEALRTWDSSHGGTAAQAQPPQGSASVIPFQRPRLAVGQPLAKVTIPAINFSGIVLEGTDTRVLSGGPGHLEGTAYPGEPDNMVISNHNTYSLSFGNLKKGDKIIVEADYGTFTYTVDGFSIVNADDKTAASSTGHASMTFTTCYPLWAGALAKQRYAIRAVLG